VTTSSARCRRGLGRPPRFPRLAHRSARAERRPCPPTPDARRRSVPMRAHGEIAVAGATGRVGRRRRPARKRDTTRRPRRRFRRCSSFGVLAAQQSSGPPWKRLKPFKGSTCVQIADQSCWIGCMRELEYSRLELDVARRPRRVGGPVHASLCAVIVGHPPSTRDLVETQNSSVARVAGARTGLPVRPRPGLHLVSTVPATAARRSASTSILLYRSPTLCSWNRLVWFDAYVASLQQAGTNLQAERFIRIRSQATRQARAYRTGRDAVLLACEPH
jgi:hypothetical protein